MNHSYLPPRSVRTVGKFSLEIPMRAQISKVLSIGGLDANSPQIEGINQSLKLFLKRIQEQEFTFVNLEYVLAVKFAEVVLDDPRLDQKLLMNVYNALYGVGERSKNFPGEFAS